jgi:hypothetical protein
MLMAIPTQNMVNPEKIKGTLIKSISYFPVTLTNTYDELRRS